MKVCSSFSLSASCSRSAATRRIGPPAEVCEGIVGYFDDASNAGACGAGIVIIVDSLISFRLLMDSGYGTIPSQSFWPYGDSCSLQSIKTLCPFISEETLKSSSTGL